MKEYLSLTATCESCGITFGNKQGQSTARFMARRFCSQRCSARGNQPAESPFVDEVNRFSAPDAETVASNALADRCMTMFRRIARERRLVDEWEAAVFCGMAA